MRAVQQLPEFNIKSSTILVVEDNAVNLHFLEKILRQSGYGNIHCVTSGEAALAALDMSHPDIVLLDIMMPGGMDGYECCEAIRQHPRGRDLPVLIQTTLKDPELRAKAFACGASDFVSKPVYPEELCARMQVHLEMRHSLRILKQYRERIAAELESARVLQQSILPDENELNALSILGHLDVAAHYAPSSEIGGDFWGMKRLFPHQTSLWMVDFSGHGVASALNAFRLQAHMKAHSPLAARPGDYMAELNEKLLQLLLRGQFATMFYAIADMQSNQLVYSCAAWPSPLLLRGNSGKVERIDGTGFPLGIGIHPYVTQMVPFYTGDVLLLYSDALVETPDAQGNFLTETEIETVMQAHQGASSGKLKEALLALFHGHAATGPKDDLTIVICQRKGG